MKIKINDKWEEFYPLLYREEIIIERKKRYYNDFLVCAVTPISFICDKCKEHVNVTLRTYYEDDNFKELCSKCKKKNTMKRHYGVETNLARKEIYKKTQDAVKKKYGVENVGQIKEVKEKIKQTNLKRRGVEYSFQSKEVREKSNKTKLKRFGRINVGQFGTEEHAQAIKNKYGVEHPLQNDDVKEKVKQTNLKKYGYTSFTKTTEYKKLLRDKYNIENVFQLEYVKNKLKLSKKQNFFDNLSNSNRLQNKVTPLFSIEEYEGVNKKYRWKCNRCGHKFEDHIDDGRIPRCFICYPRRINNKSNLEIELYNWLKSFKLNVIHNDRQLIAPLELDIFIPQKNLAIEFNGIYWHSTEFIIDKWYHQKKVELCYRKGVRLLHIWENEWLENIKKVKKHIVYYIDNMNEYIKVEKPKLVEIKNNLIWI